MPDFCVGKHVRVKNQKKKVAGRKKGCRTKKPKKKSCGFIVRAQDRKARHGFRENCVFFSGASAQGRKGALHVHRRRC
jgi:hypothetical protein